MGTLPFAVLFSADRRPSSLLALLSRAVDPRRAAGFPSHLLLLSKSILPRVLSRSPFILQNVHRYFLYLAVIFLAFLWHDAIRGFFFESGMGVGVGSIVLLVNVILLTLYLLSCHSLRHLLGGKLDCFSCASFGQQRYSTWRRLSSLNEHHMLFAWVSLFSVGFADFYVRLVSSGAMRD